MYALLVLQLVLTIGAGHVLPLHIHVHQLGGGESADIGRDERAGADECECDARGGPCGGELAVIALTGDRRVTTSVLPLLADSQVILFLLFKAGQRAARRRLKASSGAGWCTS